MKHCFNDKWQICPHLWIYSFQSTVPSPFTNTLCCKQLKYNNMKQSNMHLSCSPPLSHPSPALRRGSQERTEHHRPASLKINNGWYCQASVPFTASAPFITVCAAQSRLHIEGIHKILKTVNGWSLLAYKTHVCVFAIYWLCFCDTTLSVFWVSLLSSVFFPFIWCVSTKSFVKTCLKLIRSQPDIPQCVFLVFDMYNEAF